MNTKQEITTELIEQIVRGNQSAFEELYDITYTSIYRFVSYFIQNASDCEDVVAETYFNIWHNSTQVLMAKNIKAYLYSIARYEVYKQLRLNKKNRAILSIDDMQIDVVSRIKNADEKLEEKETLLLLTEAINSLPERCKLVYLMVREENLKYKEVADLLAITEGTVKQQMHNALSKIKEYIQEKLPSISFKS